MTASVSPRLAQRRDTGEASRHRAVVAGSTLTLRLQDIALSRGGQPLVAGLNVEVSGGEALWLTGANGVGKTTLLLACAGLIAPDDGKIEWEAGGSARTPADVAAYAAHRGPERDGLTLGEELSFWQRVSGDTAALDDRLAGVGLAGRENTPVAGLSAGQRRRLGLACLMAAAKPAWLMDEPLAGLDAEGRALVERCVSEHIRAGGLAVIASHHPVALPGISARKLVLSA